MKSIKYFLLFLVLSVSGIVGCKEETIETPNLNRKIKIFIKDVMTDIYLWYDQLPSINVEGDEEPEDFFYSLLYEEDKWSYITDDIVAFEKSLDGIEKTYGYSLAFGRFVENNIPTGNYFAIVEYVYPNTPASRAGFVRGDLIIEINGRDINDTNYMELISGTSITVTTGILTTMGISESGTVSMTSEELNLDPVLMKKIIEKEGHRIGYLLYAQFISNYNNTSLFDALQYFRSSQITDLILDLRYNPGGDTEAAQYLCSSVAPENVVNGNSTLVTYQWNDKYQAELTKNEEYQDWLGINFSSQVPVKLGLEKIHILTGYGSASASELTIAGLEPYMDVVIVGDTTYGKYTGSITLKPENYYDDEAEYSDFKNWGIQPIVLRFANSQGLTNFKDGFAPDFYVPDELLPAYPLGELNEPLLKKAVENITGVAIDSMKKAQFPVRFEVFDRAFSRFDNQKRTLFIDVPPGILKRPSE